MRYAILLCVFYAGAAFLWLFVANMSLSSLWALMVFFMAHNLEKHWRP